MKNKRVLKTLIKAAIVIGILALVATAIHFIGGGLVGMIRTHMGL